MILVALAELAAFGLFWFDKTQARDHGWRVRESTLLLVALFGGVGAWMGQHLLRHKTRKEPFRTLLGGVIVAHLIGVGAVFWLLLHAVG
ncbi:MAG: DUF1294 domain-containing protein [Brevundimonas sp.]|uniref:DUF1294 domain-containing protein n=1 Tax=Brevundimonas sp. TaxID=1871086 RepID=UPI0024897B78|nr:DUF1294 domain-containing protein [Brevundimonas sp.]MDI1325754.1 DUF1294 domain-containing protein [Brevundimonas sp.]